MSSAQNPSCVHVLILLEGSSRTRWEDVAITGDGHTILKIDDVIASMRRRGRQFQVVQLKEEWGEF